MKSPVSITKMEDLQAAYDGSYFFLAGCGGDLTEWVSGVEKLLAEENVGKPKQWLQTTGAAVNYFAGENHDPFPLDLVCLLFPLDGLDITKLAIFKINMEARWFDDVIDNMRRDGV